MIIEECLKEWLNTYPKVDFGDIDTDIIKGEDGYSIFKSPNKTIINYNDGSSLNTEYYQFFAKQSAMLDEERISNQQLMTDFENWIDDKNFNEKYPDLSKTGKLKCTEISINNSSTITYEKDDTAVYQITIAIEYLKER